MTPSRVDGFAISQLTVTPAKAEIYKLLKFMDPGFRRDDVKRLLETFYEFINERRIIGDGLGKLCRACRTFDFPAAVAIMAIYEKYL
jgi:hypothetical protein